MLEKLPCQAYYCFLDDYSGNQIDMNLTNQEKAAPQALLECSLIVVCHSDSVMLPQLSKGACFLYFLI